jgi:LysM repeat protein
MTALLTNNKEHTMFTRSTFSTIRKIGSRILAIILVLGFLGAALPAGSALAQGSNCQETYTVKSGDWLVKIAANYDGIIWSDIATANNIKAPSYVIFVGQKLCIPKPGTVGTGGTGGTGGITGSTGTGATISFDVLSGARLEVTVENAQSKSFYFVKVDDTKQASLTWFKIGTLSTGSDRDAEKTFNLPDDLEKATNFNICLKNTATDDLLCNNPSMTKLADKSDDDDDDDDDEFTGTFTVDWEGDDITIETDDFPEDEVFNVRVSELGSGALDFTIVGKLEVDDDPSDTYTYDLDGDLEDADEIRVCLKNTDTDAQKCVDLD